jgi:hypothetical protein
MGRPGATGWRTAALAAALLLAAPAPAKTINAQVNAKVIKPLVLKHIQDLDLGQVVLGSGTWSGATLSLARDGTLTCAAQLTCSGASRVAMYNVAGSKQQTVRVGAPDVTLVNQSDSTKTLTMVVDAPSTVTLPNSGSRGVDFPLGGAIKLDSTTASGTYVGTFNVTVDY